MAKNRNFRIQKGGKMKPSYEELSYQKLEKELLKIMKELAPDFQEEWMPYLMLDLLEEGAFGTAREDE